MSDNEHKNTEDAVLDAVKDIQDQLTFMKKDVDRRLDELSMEINATSQLVGMAEDATKKHFSEVLEVLSAVSHVEDGQTPLNAGVELDTVVKITEDAANRILDAADRIASRLDIQNEEMDQKDKDFLEGINDDLQEIFLACEFQDITSQRIRNTLSNLQRVEDRLSSTLDRLGLDIKVNGEVPKTDLRPKGNSQDEIDNLFSD